MVYQNLISRPGLFYINGGPAISPSVSIIGFSANLGINNQESTLSIDVTIDKSCQGIAGQIPVPGQCVYFEYNAFYFGGIVNKIDYSEAEGTGYKWTINISDPRKILENVKLLLKGYYCGNLDRDLVNFYNLNYLLEGASVGDACDGAADYPSVNPRGCYYFGSSGSGDSNGYKYGTSYFLGLKAIQNSGKPVVTSAGVRLYLNLSPVIGAASEIPYITASENDSIDLLQFITQCLDNAGYDFIVGLNRGGIITFELINRKTPPQYGLISRKIAEYQAKQTLLSYSQGLENTNLTTQKVVIGDSVTYLKQLDKLDGRTKVTDAYPTEDPLIEMFCGYDVDGTTPLMTSKLDMTRIPINVTELIKAEILPANTDPIQYIYEEEILNSGSSGQWKTFGLKWPTSSLSGLLLNSIFGPSYIQNLSILILRALAGLVNPADKNYSAAKIKNLLTAGVDKQAKYDDFAYNWFRNWIDEYYGKQWLVKFPNEFICVSPQTPYAKVTSGGINKLSDYPTEAGYPYPQDTSLIGLPINSEYIRPLFSTDGRIECFIGFSNKANSKLEIEILVSETIKPPVDNNKDGKADVQIYTKNKTINFKFEPSLLTGDYFYYKDTDVYYMKANTVNGTMFRTYDDGKPELRVLLQTPFIPQRYNPDEEDLLAAGLRAIGTLIGGIIQPSSGKGSDNGAFNDIFPNDQKRMTVPSAACIPMKSNMYVYGPWYNSLTNIGAIGSTEIISNSELNPWNYGGYIPLNIVGRMLADSGLRAQSRVETGNMQIAGPPDLNLSFYGSLVVRNITFNYGSNGVLTTYDFTTFTPKFGNYADFVNQKIKDTVKINKELARVIIGNYQKNINAINSERKARETALAKLRPILGQPSPASSSSSTFQMLLFNSYPVQLGFELEQENNSISGTKGWLSSEKKTCQEIVCYQQSSIPPSNGNNQNTRTLYTEAALDKATSVEHLFNTDVYIHQSIVSLDAILSPVSTKGSGGLPKYGRYHRSDLTRSTAIMPPVNINNKLVCNLPIVQTHLNPILSTAGLREWKDNRASGSTFGFSIVAISYGSDTSKLFDDTERQSQTDFRFSALKGPLVLQSWGYDTQGKPMPNAADNAAQCEFGYFTEYNLQDRFLKNWLGNPKTWPVGPIDLRWDRERGMWVAPPPEKLLVAQLLTDLNGLSMTDAVLLNPTSSGGTYFNPTDSTGAYNVYGPEGELISSNLGKTKIKVVDFLGRRLCQGTVVYVYHYGGGKYIVLESSVVNEETCACTEECTTSSSTSSTTTTSTTSTTSTTTTSTTTTTTTTPTTTTTYTTTSPTETLTPTCDACDLAACLEALNQGDGVLGIENGCLKVYPVTECPY